MSWFQSNFTVTIETMEKVYIEIHCFHLLTIFLSLENAIAWYWLPDDISINSNLTRSSRFCHVIKYEHAPPLQLNWHPLLDPHSGSREIPEVVGFSEKYSHVKSITVCEQQLELHILFNSSSLLLYCYFHRSVTSYFFFQSTAVVIL